MTGFLLLLEVFVVLEVPFTATSKLVLGQVQASSQIGHRVVSTSTVTCLLPADCFFFVAEEWCVSGNKESFDFQEERNKISKTRIIASKRGYTFGTRFGRRGICGHRSQSQGRDERTKSGGKEHCLTTCTTKHFL